MILTLLSQIHQQVTVYWQERCNAEAQADKQANIFAIYGQLFLRKLYANPDCYYHIY